MSMLTKTSQKGDEVVVTWDPAKVTEGDLDAAAAVAEAEKIFADLLNGTNITGANPRKARHAAFAIDPLTRSGHQIGKFDPRLPEISMRHALQGG